jgi:predicted Zn-dependent peptidase
VIETTAVNGVSIVCENIPHLRSVAFGIWINAGSRDEPDDKAGLFHFLEHLVFKGAAGRDARAINVQIDELGGNVDAFTSRETTAYVAHVLGERLDQAFDLVADLTLESIFPEEEIERERQIILDEIRMGEDNPTENIFDKLYPLRWPGHPLGRLITGSVETVNAITRDDIVRARDMFYRPPRLLISASGAVTLEKMVSLVQRRFGGLAQGPPVDRMSSLPQVKTGGHILTKPLEQAHIVLSAPGVNIASHRRNEMGILNTILGGGASSRLFQKLREEMGLVYSIHSFFEQYEETGLFGIYAACSPGLLEKVWAAIVEEMEGTVKNPPTAEEMRRAKSMSVGALLMSFESPNARMSQMATQKMYYGKALSRDEMIGEINDVDERCVCSLAEALLEGREYTALVLGPVKKGRDKIFKNWP